MHIREDSCAKVSALRLPWDSSGHNALHLGVIATYRSGSNRWIFTCGVDRHAQALLVQIVKLPVWLILSTFKTGAPSSLLQAFLLDDTGRVVADVLDHLDLLFAIVFPVINVVDRVLFLESLQQSLVFLSDSLRLLHSEIGVQRFCN